MISMRGRLAGSGLRLPRRLTDATTSSASASASAGAAAGASISSSASLNMANCGESASSGLRSDLGQNSLWRSRATCSCSCATFPSANSSICFSTTGSSGRLTAPDFMAPDYTGSGHVPRRQDVMWAFAPQIDAVEKQVQLVDRQLNSFITGIGFGLAARSLQTLEPEAEA